MSMIRHLNLLRLLVLPLVRPKHLQAALLVTVRRGRRSPEAGSVREQEDEADRDVGGEDMMEHDRSATRIMRNIIII